MGKMIKSNIKSPQNWTDGVSIIVPTFRRPKGLKNALESLKWQNSGDKPLELIVADNDPDGSAKLYVNEFAGRCEFPVIYIHASEPGVANARNEALKAARGRYLAFLDDDQLASENWLEELLSVMQDHGAGLAFCPTYARSGVTLKFKPQCLEFFTRDINKTTPGPVDDFFGCGNSLLDLRNCDLPSPPFSPKTNETGGEDDLLFSQLKAQGSIIVWTAKTFAREDVCDWRMSHKYIRVRSFAYGQGPSRICADPNNYNLKGLIKWSVIGIFQFCVYAPLAIICKIINHKGYINLMRKAAEGAGKVLWYENFRPKIYGATALKAQLSREANTENPSSDDPNDDTKTVVTKRVA